jgi:SAM-dependent methyltransferase
VTAFEWFHGVLRVERQLDCRVCGFSGAGLHVADVTALTLVAHPLTLCPDCGSIDIVASPLDSSPTDASVDGYVEVGAGIATIAEAFEIADTSRVRRFLDVGCNYGFALDLGRFAHGWQVLGVEPSLAGTRGARELGLDIRAEYLSPESEIGADFDLILASEVVEHVPEPVVFLQALRERLSERGVLLLTTPAAEIIGEGEAEAEILAALSPGYHVFIASATGLELMLRSAGFAAVSVQRRGGQLTAVASVSIGPASSQVTVQDRAAMLAYYRWRGQNAERGSALASGMATRYLRLACALGRYHEAAAMIPRVTESIRLLHGIDLQDAAGALAAVAASEAVPWVLAGASFALGLMELLHYENPARAALYFETAELSAQKWKALAGVVDLDIADLLIQAPRHQTLALERVRIAAGEADPVLAEPDAARAVRWAVDVYWCDAWGTYLQGWAHAEELPVHRLSFRQGSAEVPAEFTPRPDVLTHWQMVPDAERVGFTVYLPGRPGAEITLVARTSAGEISAGITLPDHPLPAPGRDGQAVMSDLEAVGRFTRQIADAPPGPVLAVGIRSPTLELLRARLAMFGGREVIGFDIHEGHGVDVVGDAHRLGTHFPPNSFAVVYSTSVLEHLSMPWLFAAAAAGVLMPGGLAIQQAPWAWPTHAEPNDFWRLSADGLRQLFTEELGFRIVATGETGAAVITPTDRWRNGQMLMPTGASALAAWVIAEKVDDRAREVRWPYDEDRGAALAAAYPVDGLAAENLR